MASETHTDVGGDGRVVPTLRSAIESLEGTVLDTVVVVLSLLTIGGLVADARRHATTDLSFAEEGFLTLEHVFFYSTFLGIAVVLFLATYVERRRGASWVEAVPTGYGWGILGVAMFGFGGVADFGWHSTFGFERSVEALVSPSHLLLGGGAGLFLSSPLRSAWYREARPSGIGTGPALVALGLVLTVVTLFGGFLNPLVRPYPHFSSYGSMRFAMGLLVVFPLLFVGTAIAVVDRFRLPPGALTFVFSVPALGITAIEGHFPLVLPAVTAGVVADCLVQVRPPTVEDTRALRAFAALVPVTLVGTYFAVVEWQYGISHRMVHEGLHLWSVHVVGGTVALAGVAGLILSYFVTPGIAGGEGSP